MKIIKNKLIKWRKYKHIGGYDLDGYLGESIFCTIFKSHEYKNSYGLSIGNSSYNPYYKTQREAKAGAEIFALKYLFGVNL